MLTKKQAPCVTAMTLELCDTSPQLGLSKTAVGMLLLFLPGTAVTPALQAPHFTQRDPRQRIHHSSIRGEGRASQFLPPFPKFPVISRFLPNQMLSNTPAL